jgi:hypothetical protein
MNTAGTMKKNTWREVEWRLGGYWDIRYQLLLLPGKVWVAYYLFIREHTRKVLGAWNNRKKNKKNPFLDF